MAVVTFFAAYVLTSLVIPLEWLAIPTWPFPVANVLTNLLLSVLMTYAVMPTVSRLLGKWLFPEP